MKTWGVCMKNELNKISRRKKYRIMIAVTILGALIGLITNGIISFSLQSYPYVILSLCCYLCLLHH